LEKITKDFYGELYGHKDISEEALTKVMEDVPAISTNNMNEELRKEITEKKLFQRVKAIAKGKAPENDGIPMELFHSMWSTIDKDFYRMIRKNIEEKQIHLGVTKGLIYLMPKDGDVKDLKYWRPITLLTVT